MRILQIILAAVIATSAMTLFSYILSAVLKKQFKEPVLLADALEVLQIQNCQMQHIAAWAIHYTIGISFVIAYDILWNNTFIDPTWFSGILLGIASGILGILGWKLIFRLVPQIVRFSFNAFFTQLFLAHIIFALAAVFTYRILGFY